MVGNVSEGHQAYLQQVHGPIFDGWIMKIKQYKGETDERS